LALALPYATYLWFRIALNKMKIPQRLEWFGKDTGD